MEKVVLVQEEMTVKQKLQDILMVLSWREMARSYFGKSSGWIYQKLDESNGKKFSDAEKEQLRRALVDLADRIRRAADTI